MQKLTKNQEKALNDKNKFRWQPVACYRYGDDWKKLALPTINESIAKGIAMAALVCDEHTPKMAGVLDRTNSIVAEITAKGNYV